LGIKLDKLNDSADRGRGDGDEEGEPHGLARVIYNAVQEIEEQKSRTTGRGLGSGCRVMSDGVGVLVSYTRWCGCPVPEAAFSGTGPAIR
jgi:hypothetical protein